MLVAEGLDNTRFTEFNEEGEIRIYMDRLLTQDELNQVRQYSLSAVQDMRVLLVKFKGISLSDIASSLSGVRVLGWQLFKPAAVSWGWLLAGVAILATIGRKR